MRKLLQLKLKILSKLILAKYRPEVIGITGSVGKTSAKEAIFSVLSGDFKARKNIKNYNNEIGVPLTIIGVETGGKSLLRWLYIFSKAFWLLIWKDKNYPTVLVLEMGADKPGDIDYLLSIVKCRVGILTAVSESHLEYFGTLERIAQEKRLIISRLAKEGFAIINIDNDLAWQQKAHTKSNVMSFGIKHKASAQAENIVIMERDGELGLNFKLSYQGTTIPIFLPGIISYQHIYAVLAAVCVGIVYNINLVDIGHKLQQYHGVPGRTRYIPGIKGSKIIDDTYNSSPLATKAALDLMPLIPNTEAGDYYAVLGDMLELGRISEEAHLNIGKKVNDLKIDYLLAFGEKARDIARGAIKAGMDKDHVYTFSDHHQAGLFLQDRVKKNDIILVKGSQGVRMEKIVKEIMAEPNTADDLLVRQTKDWEDK